MKPTYYIIERGKGVTADQFYMYGIDATHYAVVRKSGDLRECNRVEIAELDNECNLNDQLMPGQWIRVEISDLATLPVIKPTKPKIQHRKVSKSEIDDLRTDANLMGMNFSYRARGDKQYVSIVINDEWDPCDYGTMMPGNLVRRHFPKAMMTSGHGSYGEGTYRINP